MTKINTIGKEEEEAVLRVLRSGNLSGYVATSPFGGAEVSALEEEWEKFFGAKHAVACNSATSGLLAACMAAGVGPYDEVIVPYYTMSATAAAPKVLGATVVLGNIDEHYCLDPNDVSNLINENTKAVIATNMFGHPAQLKRLRMICDGAGVVLIEDNAQAIMAKEDGVYTGTIGHIGVFSLNVHKHIQTGEGGICVTNDHNLWIGLQQAINHGECRKSEYPGLNLRMTEITAAIAREQLKKLPAIMEQRRATAEAILDACKNRDWLIDVPVRRGCEHSYYALPLLVNTSIYRIGGVVSFLSTHLWDVSIGYHGNLLTFPFSTNMIEPDRLAQLTKHQSYSNIHQLILVEICSHEIPQANIDRIRIKNDRRAVT